MSIVRDSLYGVVIGDAMGVPTELRNDINYDYEKLDAINECIINRGRTR